MDNVKKRQRNRTSFVKGHSHWDNRLPVERFLVNVVISTTNRWNETHCWEWKGSISKGGYGYFQYNGKLGYSHRFAYEYFKGEIPNGLCIDHLCRNRKCVNPDHLEAVTQQENNRRGIGVVAINIKKTECPKGHQYNGQNTYYRPDGKGRQCLKCRNERNAMRPNRAERRGHKADPLDPAKMNRQQMMRTGR